MKLGRFFYGFMNKRWFVNVNYFRWIYNLLKSRMRHCSGKKTQMALQQFLILLSVVLNIALIHRFSAWHKFKTRNSTDVTLFNESAIRSMFRELNRKRWKIERNALKRLGSLSEDAPSVEEQVIAKKNAPIWLSVENMDKFVFEKNPLILGKRREKKAEFVIGIPSVHREHAHYLPETLHALINNADAEEKKNVVIVVCVNDIDQAYQQKVKSEIQKKYSKEVDDGMIQVIVPNFSQYPKFANLPLLYGDNDMRVRWRSKQCLDYAFLFYYVADLAEYFVGLEDDILAVPNYIKTMRNAIKSHAHYPWSNLEFGKGGFIGITYRTKHLKSLAKYVRFHHWSMPVDWHYVYFNTIFLNGVYKEDRVRPIIFKHMGKHSSLKGQIRKLEDFEKKPEVKQIINRIYQLKANPPAKISTTIFRHYQNHDINSAYGGNGFYWGISPKVGDSVTITFDVATVLQRIVFASGTTKSPNDSFLDTKLKVSESSQCNDYSNVKQFADNAIVDHKWTNNTKAFKCIQLELENVRVINNRTQWLLISEIAVLT